jgi:hypothetical protein
MNFLIILSDICVYCCFIGEIKEDEIGGAFSTDEG